MLLEAGADANLTSPSGKTTRKGECELTTPLAQAASGGSLACVRKLLAYGARQTDAMPLWWALRLEHTDMAKLMLPFDPPVDTLAKLQIRKKLSDARLEAMLELAPDVPDRWEPADHVGELDWAHYFPGAKTDSWKLEILEYLLEIKEPTRDVMLLPQFYLSYADFQDSDSNSD